MTEQTHVLPADDLSRASTIVHADDRGLIHLGVGGGTYTILISGEQTARNTASERRTQAQSASASDTITSMDRRC